ncbi:hypothetical protein Back11_23650 [Paenibacillus baekrokdamisoli]|uniref:Uncharacterized protein n=1 Tax=Paenibacillus baekrokdamisoli TaxID=1712516 RepID=A0A3G9IQ76_9BACL|nr:hypothetical protein [Paenibacillus baekrokdamisoli]MBB3069626.1 hypothetical protein [Paenibacillus baekrokdamisoli]BBH21020.1 hypothetical protein Back11_23650 [Paenibacillus baekrokdamisoli]
MNVRHFLLPRKRHPFKNQTTRLTKLSDEVTNVLKKIIIILLIAVVLSQLALQIPRVRVWITGVDRMEGTPI